MTCKKWTIVLVPFPFSDLSTTKKRPALVVSPDEYNTYSDAVIAFITSNLDVKHRLGDYLIQNWHEAHLPKPSMIRMKFATIDNKMIIKQIGRLSAYDISEFKKSLTAFFIA
ncbi:type II toxin-antitoxin system PemK/MazF family toxin [bacterium]|nr:type II toxin-antitoxin system PemK/MazF family toxin [bacterium]